MNIRMNIVTWLLYPLLYSHVGRRLETHLGIGFPIAAGYPDQYFGRRMQQRTSKAGIAASWLGGNGNQMRAWLTIIHPKLDGQPETLRI